MPKLLSASCPRGGVGVTSARSDDRDDATEGEVWAQVGRELMRKELADLRIQLEGAFRDAEEELYGPYDGAGEYSGDITPEHVQALRTALHDALHRVEEQVAPVAGCEPWGEPPRIPNGALWEWTNHPRDDDVDPREYLDGEADE